MPFDWRFRNFKRDPQPFLNGAVIDAENARNNLVQNAGNSMEGYTPLESTLAAQAMEGYNPVIPATQSQLAAGASQAMEGYTPNGVGRSSVPNDMHGGMGQPDLDGYGAKFEADIEEKAKQAQAEQEAAQKQAQIDSIKARISELESQIAANQAKLKNWQGVDGQIAALEARKINTQDPTSVWRWKATQEAAKQQRAEDLARVEAEKQKTKDEQKQYLLNKINATLPTMQVGWTTTPEQAQQYKNTLAGLKAEAMNNKMPLDQIRDMEAQLSGELPYQRAQNAMNEMRMAADRFNVTEADGGFGKNAKKYQDFLMQQYTKITRDYPEAKYDPEFNKVFQEADQKFRKKVKDKKIVPPGRK